VFLLVDRFTLERFGDTAGRLLAVKARTAHVRFGLTYTFMVQAVVGISKLNTSAVEIESGSDFRRVEIGPQIRLQAVERPGRGTRSCLLIAFRSHRARNRNSHDQFARQQQDEDKQRILKILNLEDHVLFAPSRLRDREASFPYQRVSVNNSLSCPDTMRLHNPKTCILTN